MNARKASRFLGVSLALVVLVIFATGVVSDWSHREPMDDAHCPYCHLGHQALAWLVVAPAITLLKPVASPLPSVDIVQVTGDIFSQTEPRSPPAKKISLLNLSVKYWLLVG
jgi:hypothetical protein